MSKESQNHNKKSIFRRIGKGIGIFLLILAGLFLISTIRHQIKKKTDKKIYQNAYGETYTTEHGDRLQFTVYDSASEDVAVILPGFSSASTYYEFHAVAEGLQDRYKIISVDPLGVGLSDRTDLDRSVENYCEELHGLMQHLGYDRYTLIGHSIAGVYALYYANHYTDEVTAFLGIDSSVPRQVDEDIWAAKPKNQLMLYTILRPLLYESGINRIITELTFDETMAQIPTLTDDDRAKALAMFSSIPLNHTQMNEMHFFSHNVETCRDMKFPESVPVLYVLSQDNCERMPAWEKLHRELLTNPDSKMTVISGSHNLHMTNLQGLLTELKNWDPVS
ncbi:MAG TPA: hypothetical protein DCG49_13230 [Ruminococcus sp.]|nr:hypothetical protein [Ruminococcus sp.]